MFEHPDIPENARKFIQIVAVYLKTIAKADPARAEHEAKAMSEVLLSAAQIEDEGFCQLCGR